MPQVAGIRCRQARVYIDALWMQSCLAPSSSFPSLPHRRIQAHSHGVSATALTYLSLVGLGLRRMDTLPALPALRVLVLAFNELQRIDGLAAMTALEVGPRSR